MTAKPTRREAIQVLAAAAPQLQRLERGNPDVLTVDLSSYRIVLIKYNGLEIEMFPRHIFEALMEDT